MDCEGDFHGEGTSSMCWKGHHIETGKEVAIKVYKTKTGEPCSSDDVRMTKFRNQIRVLQSLATPFEKPEDARLWNDALSSTPPSQFFMHLIDYSKDEKGNPGPDPKDGMMYIITEFAQYSLKEFLAYHRKQETQLALDMVRSLTRVIMLVAAGLHAKGLVHLDLKPENLMFFNGILKLIDVDGCVKKDKTIYIDDFSLSFSPCYCAPEWANFLIEEADLPSITVSPALDVWSIGMTICELVLQDAMLKSHYACFMRHGRSQQECGFLFMEWLGSTTKLGLPSKLRAFDSDLTDLIENKLLVSSSKERATLAEALGHKFVCSTSDQEFTSSPAACDDTSNQVPDMPEHNPRGHPRRAKDTSDGKFMEGILYKLNYDGNPNEEKDWLKRDFWINTNGSLCYFSQRENKRLVLEDGERMTLVTVVPFKEGVRDYAFQLQMQPEHGTEAHPELDVHVLACETELDYRKWTHVLEHVQKYTMMFTMHLGQKMASDAKDYKLTVRNRRLKVQHSAQQEFQPILRSTLWKLKTGGNSMKESDWLHRDMWVSKNGSLVYHSERENRELVYYASTDVAKAVVKQVGAQKSIRPYAFEVQLPHVDGVEFSPGFFAAESEDMREKWISHIRSAKELHSA